jgi:hypothetical protein
VTAIKRKILLENQSGNCIRNTGTQNALESLSISNFLSLFHFNDLELICRYLKSYNKQATYAMMYCGLNIEPRDRQHCYPTTSGANLLHRVRFPGTSFAQGTGVIPLVPDSESKPSGQTCSNARIGHQIGRLRSQRIKVVAISMRRKFGTEA